MLSTGKNGESHHDETPCIADQLSVSSPGADDAPLEALRGAYCRRLSARVRQLQGDWQKLRKSGFDIPAMDAFHRQVHSPAGSGDSFGFTSMGQAAHRLELMVLPFLTEYRPPPEDQQRQLEIGLAEVISAAREPDRDSVSI